MRPSSKLKTRTKISTNVTVAASLMLAISTVALVFTGGMLSFLGFLGFAPGEVIINNHDTEWKETIEGNIAKNKWSVIEFTLEADRDYSNPYSQVAINADFYETADKTKSIKGFWDGGRIYKVRLTPPNDSTWNFRISSETSDNRPLRLRINNIEKKSTYLHGFLRRDSDYPQHFIFDDGMRFFMWGQTYYEIVPTAVYGDRKLGPDGSEAWQYAIKQTKSKGINKIRFLITNWAANLYIISFPYEFEGDTEEEVVLDHSRVNLLHFSNMDRVIDYLAEQDMIAEIIFFADSDFSYGTESQDKQLVRYVLARYAAYPHVMWSLANEWQYSARDYGRTEDFWKSIGRIVKNEDPWSHGENNGKYYWRPLSIHQKTMDSFEFFDDINSGDPSDTTGWVTHAIVQYGVRNSKYKEGDRWGYHSIENNNDHGVPVVNDEYGYFGEYKNIGSSDDRKDQRQAMWGIALAGGYGTAGDARIPSGETSTRYWPIFSSTWYNADEYDDIKNLISFWTSRGMRYWLFTPQAALSSIDNRVYVSGISGNEYVVYAANGGEVKLSVPQGTYQIYRHNPRTSDNPTTQLLDAQNATSITLVSPDANDWVFHIIRPTLFVRGDANSDDELNISDPIFTLQYLFLSGEVPKCLDSADVDDSGVVNMTDPISILKYLYNTEPGTPQPPAPPFDQCGIDPIPADELSCVRFPPCE